MGKNAAVKVTTRTAPRTAAKPAAKKVLAANTKRVTFEEAQARVFSLYKDGLRRLAK